MRFTLHNPHTHTPHYSKHHTQLISHYTYPQHSHHTSPHATFHTLHILLPTHFKLHAPTASHSLRAMLVSARLTTANAMSMVLRVLVLLSVSHLSPTQTTIQCVSHCVSHSTIHTHTLHTLYSAIHTLHSPLHTPHSTLHTPHSTHRTPHTTTHHKK